MTEVQDQLIRDLEGKIKQYNNSKFAMRTISEKCGIHQKTLSRILNRENKPNHQTLVKVYRFLLNTHSEKELLEKTPKIIQEQLLKSLGQNKNKGRFDFFYDIEEEILKDRVYSIIYCLSGAGAVNKNFIGFKFGNYGLEVLDKMIKQNVLIPGQKPDEYLMGPTQASLGPDTIKKIGLDLIQFFLSPEKSLSLDKNFLGFFIEGLSEEAYQSWIKIDEDAFKAKMKIASEPGSKGQVKAFTFNATDTMDQYEKHLQTLH